ncbi:MAG: hypothetical protein K2G88_07595 [Oscillospiraceae bacterium]|nr:hypothetical protein [Oscillospiraceae bacterium]
MSTEIHDMSHYDKCRTMMMKHKKNHMLRVGLVAFLMLINAYVKVIRSPIDQRAFYLFGFFFGVGILIYCIITLAIGLFAVPEKPKLLATTCILLFIGIIGEWLAPYLGIPMLLLFLWQIPEAKQAVWIKQQEGYPHFNERFTEQMLNFGKEYEPEHKFDDLHHTEMPDMPETPSPDFVVKEMPSIPEFTQDIPELLSSDLTATEKISDSEIMQDISNVTISDLIETEQTVPELTSLDSTATEQMQNNDLGTEKLVPELTSLDSTTTEQMQNNDLETEKSAPEFKQDILQANQMQNSDLGTDRILMKNFKSDINI